MNIRISPRAEKELKKISTLDQIAVAQKIRLLVSAALPSEEKLAGFSHIYRIRVGNYRIVYKRTSVEIYIVLISHRKDVYRKLSELLG